ncbi:MAG: hypothetical protein H6737_05255 [Alphaproteobacteria bacterium]|nr:hypothetical protein [Alphaproteobacteria bacterium]
MWILALALGCSPSAIPLGSVAEAVDHPDAERLALTAVSVKGLQGIALVDTPEGPREAWVLPVRDVHGELGSEVSLWVTPPQLQEVGVKPEIWISRLEDRFDDHAGTWAVGTRIQPAASDPIALAVRDAESRHGLKAVPGAAVLVFPPP